MPADDKTRKIRDLEKRVRELEKENRKLGRERDKFEATAQSLGYYAGLFKDISYLTGKSFKLEVFMDRIMDRVQEAARAECASLFLLNETRDRLEFAVVKGPDAEDLEGQSIPAGEGIAGHVVQSGKPYLCSDVKSDGRWSPRIAGQTGRDTRDILAIPLKARGKAIGVIEVINREDGESFSQDDVKVLKTMANEISVGIESARLLLQARKQAEQFSTLSKLAAVLNSSLKPQAVRRKAMEACVELLDCETGSLYLIDEEKGELYFEVALGDKGDLVKEIRLKIGEGVAGWVAQEGKSDLVPDTASDPRWASKVDEKSKFQTRNMVTVPVKAKGKTIGVLQAINKLRGKRFNKGDLFLLESLADTVAIALENARLYEEQKVMFVETAEALATAIEKRDPYTGGHTKRVRDFSMAAAKYMDLGEDTLEWLELAAILHDIGKIGVDDSVLRKPGRLDYEEFQMMKKHPVWGFEILQHIKQLEPCVPGMKFHHERYDGKGYPEGLNGLEAPLIARIISVADTWDAMTSDRPYRDGLGDKVAAKELRDCSGTQFDPAVVKAFLKAHKKGEVISQNKDGKKRGRQAKKSARKRK